MFRFLLAFGVLLALGSPSYAQRPQPDAPAWTEADIVHAARIQPESALAAWGAADADAVASGAGLLPNPSVAWERQQLFGDGAQSQDQLRVGWRVPISGVRGAERHLARVDARFAAWLAEEQRARAVGESLVAFYEALAAERRVAELTALAETFDEAARRARTLAERGELGAAEAGRVEVEASLVRASVRAAEGDALQARARLASWLAVETLPALDGALAPDASAEVDLDAALERRLATLGLARDEATRARRAGRRAAWPDLDVEAGWLRQRQQGGNGEGYVVTASLVLPLADRGQAARGRSETTSRLEEIARALELRVRAELEAAERERTLWTEERQRFEPSAALAATVLRAALARYAAGEASFVEIVDARRMAVDVAERAVAIDLALRRAELRRREAAGEWR